MITKNAVDCHVGRRIQQRRFSMRLSKDRLARYLSVDEATVEDYEEGLKRVSASKLYEMSKALDVPVAWFFEGYQIRR